MVRWYYVIDANEILTFYLEYIHMIAQRNTLLILFMLLNIVLCVNLIHLYNISVTGLVFSC